MSFPACHLSDLRQKFRKQLKQQSQESANWKLLTKIRLAPATSPSETECFLAFHISCSKSNLTSPPPSGKLNKFSTSKKTVCAGSSELFVWLYQSLRKWFSPTHHCEFAVATFRIEFGKCVTWRIAKRWQSDSRRSRKGGSCVWKSVE